MAKINYELGLSDQLLTIEDIYDLRFQELLEGKQNEVYSE